MYCQQCKERLYPQDPTVSFQGMKSLCYSCPNWSYIQFLEYGNGCDDFLRDEPPDYSTAIALNQRIDSLRGELIYTRNKIDKFLDKKKKDTLQGVQEIQDNQEVKEIQRIREKSKS